MKCKYCELDVAGNFCANCGNKIIKDFSQENFRKIQEYVFNNINKYISNDFEKEIHIEPIGMKIVTMNGLYKTFKKYGYLFRIVEEKFGNPDLVDIGDILKNNKTIKEATDFLDSQSEIDSISISGINEKYIIEKTIVPIFESYIEDNINYVANQIIDGKINGIDKNKLENHFDYFREMLFRNATWGYVYRLLESRKK